MKDAMLFSAWVASNYDPESRAYYQRKRAEGKKHNAAIMCLARRRCNVIFAMLRDRTMYEPKTTTPPEPAPAAA